MSSIRIDKGFISGYRKDDGSLVANVRLTKTGVFPYLHSDGRIIKEAKLPEELFKDSTIQSANGAVVTDSHPNGLVTSSNYKDLSKGNLSNVKQDGIYLVGQEKIFDPDLIDKISRGEQVEVSIGFKQETDWTKGTFDGQDYDCIQRNIEINHLAHVDKGRAGGDVRILLDSKIDYAIMQEANNNMTNKPNTITWRVDGKDFTIDKSVIDKAVLSTTKKDEDDTVTTPVAEMPDAPKPIDAAMIAEDAKKLSAIMTTLQGKFGVNSIEELTALIDAQKAVIEAYQAKANMTPNVEQAVADSILVIKNAENFGVKTDSYNPSEVRKAFISKFLPSYSKEKLDSLNDESLRITYDAACEVAKQTSVKSDSADNKVYTDSADKMLEDAKNKYFNRGLK